MSIKTTTGPGAMAGRLRKENFRKSLDYFIFMAPAVILMLVASVIPFVMNMFYSLMKWNGVSNNKQFVGLRNFENIFTSDPDFWAHFLFTFKFLLFFLVCANVIALAIALMLYHNRTINNIVRMSVLLPFVIGYITVGLIWQSILGPGFTSIANFSGISLFARGWLSEKNLVFYSILMTSLWQNIGFYMIIYIAGLMSIPQSVIEAAKIDGASAAGSFFRIKFPFLAPSLSMCLFLSITYSLKLFEIILVLTNGGPGGYTTTIAFDIYTTAFQKGFYGYGTAKSLVFMAVVLAITVIQLKLTKRMEVE